MGWLDEWLTDLGGAAPKPIAPAIPKPLRQPKLELKSVWFQTRRPRDAEDPGECEAGYYSIAGDVLTIRDEKGMPTGKEYRLGPGEDAQQIAARLAREAWVKARGETDFNRPLGYQQSGVA